jgi:hypothetical protein
MEEPAFDEQRSEDDPDEDPSDFASETAFASLGCLGLGLDTGGF